MRIRGTGKAAQPPNYVCPNIFFDTEKLEYPDDGSGYISDHNADNEQRNVAAHLGADKNDQPHYCQRAYGSGYVHGHLAHITQAAQCHSSQRAAQQNDQSNTQTGTGADAENGRTGQRIAKDGLHLQATNG